DWLHRELLAWLDLAAQDTYALAYDELSTAQQAGLRDELKEEYRTNTLDTTASNVSISERRAHAIQETGRYYQRLYGDDPALQSTRANFAMKEGTLPDAQRREDLSMFFFWTAWAAATNRPDSHVTYTNNWPGESLIDNHALAAKWVWLIVC